MASQVRPRLKLLDEPLIEAIISEAMQVLERVGVFIENAEGLTLLEQAGARVDLSTRRAWPGEHLIQTCLERAPREVLVYDRSGDLSLNLSDDNVHYVPGSAALRIRDGKTGRIRNAVTEDYVSYTRLVDSLACFPAQSTAIICSDVPPEIADRYRLFLSLINGTKPVVTGTFARDGFKPMHEMLTAIRGSHEALAEMPLAIFDVCPTPPLKWSDLTLQTLIDCARASIPSEIVSMPLAGATAPVTLTGSLVQHTAEALSGVVLSQLARPHAPVIYGGSPSIFDMRYGTTPMGAIETMMIDMAYAQIGKHLGLPTHTYMGLSDAKDLDSQSGIESGVGMVLAGLAGVNVVSGAGMLDFESCQSLEKLVIDHEACRMAHRLLAGIEPREDPMGVDLLLELASGGDFLKSPSTRKWFRQEFLFPTPVIDRKSREEWERGGAAACHDQAGEEVKRILNSHTPKPLDDTLRAELERIMQSEASRFGMDQLPAVG
jgi:trimethylamine--corrinoid protein Co-methyltransferase